MKSDRGSGRGAMERRRVSLAAIEGRRALVARGLLAHRSIRQIAAELVALPDGERPADCSVATVGRDARALRDEWAAGRQAAVDRLMGEDLARFAEIEAVLLPKCIEGNGEAIDRWLKLVSVRASRVGGGGGSGSGRGGEAGGSGASGASGVAIELRVRFVDDWRAVRGAAFGATVMPVVEVDGVAGGGPAALPGGEGGGGSDG